jgi:NTE family protein
MKGACGAPFCPDHPHCMSSPRNPSARPAAPPRAKPRIGLALAGGGPLGAIYEIGALCALDESVPGLDLNALDGYVGVSAGGSSPPGWPTA